MEIKRLTVGELAVNCYIILSESSAVIIDAGGDADKIIRALEGRKPLAVVLTHGHCDHIGAVKQLQDMGARVYISNLDAPKLSDGYLNLATPFGFDFSPVEADVTFDDGETLQFEDISLKTILTPGHTVGSACFLMENTLFSGDTLFQGSVGRWDFPDGNFEALQKSIKEKLYTLPENIRVLAGHGAETTIKEEKTFNPFVR